MANVTIYLRTLKAAALSGATTPADEAAYEASVAGYIDYLAEVLAEGWHSIAENECDMSAMTYLVDADDYEDEQSAHEVMTTIDTFWDWWNRTH